MHKNRGRCACCVTQFLLRSVVKPSYKTDMSKDNDYVLLVCLKFWKPYLGPIFACFFISTYQKMLPDLVSPIFSLENTFTFQSQSSSYCFVWLLLFADFQADVMCTTLTL